MRGDFFVGMGAFGVAIRFRWTMVWKTKIQYGKIAIDWSQSAFAGQWVGSQFRHHFERIYSICRNPLSLDNGLEAISITTYKQA